MSQSATLTALLSSDRYVAASAAYDAIADAHGVDYEADWRYVGGVACICGRDFATGQARGLHVAATRREAGRAFDAAVKVYDGAARR